MNVENPNKYGEINLLRLEAFEKLLGSSLPKDYRQFLIQHNGGKPTPSYFLISDKKGNDAIDHFYGLHDGPRYARLDNAFEVYKGRIPGCLLKIADDPLGNAICIGIKGKYRGKIYFWDHELEGNIWQQLLGRHITLVSDSFRNFLDSLFEWVDPNETEIERIIRSNDIAGLKALLAAGYEIESTDEYGRTAIEQAAIKAQNEIIQALFDAGAKLRSSSELAKRNAEFFDKHQSTFELLEKLKARS